MQTTVIIPSLDSPLIDRVVRAARRDDTRRPDEIIVVGRDAPGLLARLPEVRFIETPRPVLPGAARNIGAAAASGDVLVFLDADCIPDAGWLSAHTSRQSRGEHVVGGAVLYDTDSYWRLADNLSSFHECDAGRPSGPRPYLPTLNLSVRAAAFAAVGPMDPGFPRGEDLDWTIRAARAGFRPFFEPAARVWHRPPGRDSARSVLARWRVAGSWMVHVRRRYPAVFGGRDWLLRPLVVRLLAPAIAAAATWRVYGVSGPGHRYPLALPAVYATKLAWCWGASQPADATEGT